MTKSPDTRAQQARDAWLRALKLTAGIEQHPKTTLPVLLERFAERSDAAPALLSASQSFTYRELASRCHQYARWGRSTDLRSGDVVALFMPNCPEYLAVWLGLCRLGVVVALLNTQLRGDVLGAAIAAAAPRGILVDPALLPALESARARLAPGLRVWVCGNIDCNSNADGMAHDFIASSVALQPTEPLSERECDPPTLDATALYVYTSGTTGLPKAARVSHYRVMQWSHWFAGMMDSGPLDRLYDCLPLYHSIGGIVAVGAMLVGGGATVIRPRFSATDFWRDVRDQRCTVFQYIGELCRYLTSAAPQPEETGHGLRLACGNGMRRDVWERFEARFGIPRILEYYASTEGNFSLYNCEGEPGAIGRIPPYLRHRLPVELVRFDRDSGTPRRESSGRCERCDDDETGEALGLIPRADAPRVGRFEGYADAAATKAKILHDVFAPGDSWYRTGDLMRRDARGFYYFVDRVGDTYRWKGENVSTAEVLSVLTAADGIVDGAVYGVHVAGTDGRAGMAALVVNAQFALETLHDTLAARLPAFARPVFLRLLSGLDYTTTFRPRTQDLMQAGFDPATIEDALYVALPPEGRYVRLDGALHGAIIGGRVRI